MLYSDPAGRLDWAAQCATPAAGQTGVSAEVRRAQAAAVQAAATDPKALPSIAETIRAAVNSTMIPITPKNSTQLTARTPNKNTSITSPRGRQAPPVGGLMSPHAAASPAASMGVAVGDVASGIHHTPPSQAVVAANQTTNATSGATYVVMFKLRLVMVRCSNVIISVWSWFTQQFRSY